MNNIIVTIYGIEATGGAEIQSIKFINYLLSKGDNVTLITTGKRENILNLFNNQSLLKLYCISTYVKTKNITWLIFSLFVLIITTLQCLQHKNEVYMTYMAFPTGFFTIIITSLFRKQVFLSLRGGDINMHLFSVFRLFTKFSLIKASGLIAISTELQNIVYNEGLKIDKIKYIPNGVKIRNKNMRKITNETQIIGYIGQLIPRKRVSLLIDAASILSKEFSNFKIWIIGDGPLRNQLENYAISKGISNKINFFGPVNHQDIFHLMSKLNLVVLQSDSEGMPNVLIEACSLGIPIISTNVGGVKDILEEEYNGLILNSDEPLEYASLIKKIISKPDFAQILGQNAKRKQEKFFNFEKNSIRARNFILNQ